MFQPPSLPQLPMPGTGYPMAAAAALPTPPTFNALPPMALHHQQQQQLPTPQVAFKAPTAAPSDNSQSLLPIMAAGTLPAPTSAALPAALPQLPTMTLPHFLSVPADVAEKLTLTANDCYRLGVFPYFRENVSGMFVRIRTDKANHYVWARVVCGITADQLAELGLLGAIGGSDLSTSLVYSLPTAEEERTIVMSASTAAGGAGAAAYNAPDIKAWLSLPNIWRRRLVEEPIYEWREKRFEIYLICEHPFAESINKSAVGAVLSSSEDGSGADAADATVAPPNSTFITSFRQLAKENTPKQSEIDGYCGQFVPLGPNGLPILTPAAAAAAIALKNGVGSNPFLAANAAAAAAAAAAANAAAAAAAASSPFALAKQNDPLAYVPAAFKEAFMTKPHQTEAEAEMERLENRIRARVDRAKESRANAAQANKAGFVSSGPNVPTAGGEGAVVENAAVAEGGISATPTFPHANPAAEAAAKWRQYFEKNVLQRPLSKDDASKIVAANTRLSNVAGNAVIRGAVLYNINLSRASQIEAARRSVEMLQSQQMKAAQKALSRAALTQTSIGGEVVENNLAAAVEGEQPFPLSTQLGTSSQNVGGGEGEEGAVRDPSVAASQGVRASSTTSATAAGTAELLSVESLLQAALGPSASKSNMDELREKLFSQSVGATAAGSPTAASIANMMMLLTNDELRALERDDSQFNTYLSNEDRRKGLDVLASVTTRNTKVNVGLRLQGYKLMEERDREREAHDDTMQTMWVTNTADRKKEADEYAKMKAAEGAAKGDKAGGDKATKGPKYLSEAEELELYKKEAALVNATILSRQGSTFVANNGPSSPLGSSSGHLSRANSAAEASGSGLLGRPDDLDDLLSLSQKVRATSTVVAQSSSSSNNTPLVRDASILSQEQRLSVSQALGRVPIVATGAKRGRE